MDSDHLKAVSFTNSYFALADGLVSGIEYFLAENVVLDWFGKTIKGRHNVAAFMSMHKVNSRHVFNDICPNDSIGYNRKSNRRRRKRKSKSSNISLQNGNVSFENELNGQSTPLNESISSSFNESISSNDRSCSWTKTHCSTEGETDLKLELHDNTLSNNFKLESIKSTDIEEIEQRIRQISLEDKLNTESPKGNGKELRETKNFSVLESSMKFIEAHGEILFSKRSRRQSDWNDYKLIATGSPQTWRKPCKLQIAYSSKQVCLQPKLPANNNQFGSDFKANLVENQTKLLNFEQIIGISNQFAQNDYSGYLRNINVDRKEAIFFENFDEYLLKNQRKNVCITPRYINNQLSLQEVKYDQNESQNNLLINNLIHIIIYEGRSRCRMNLSQKFI